MESQRSIADWRVSVFGKSDRPDQIVGRALLEFAELMELIVPPRQSGLLAEAVEECREVLSGEPLNYDTERLVDEMADVLIVLYGAADDAGHDLQAAVDHKMAVNRARKWRVDGPGQGRHVV